NSSAPSRPSAASSSRPPTAAPDADLAPGGVLHPTGRGRTEACRGRAGLSSPRLGLWRSVMQTRPELLRRAAGRGACFGVPAAPAEQAFAQDAPRLPPAGLLDTDPGRYWAELRRQWLLAPDHLNLNCGSVGCSPLPVLNAVIDHLLSAE